jgi:hypothetical protein
MESLQNGYEYSENERMDERHPAKYKSTITNILSKHCSEIKSATEDAVYSLTTLSKKKLKELVTKQNNEMFAFLLKPEKIPQSLAVAETIFKRYGQEPPVNLVNIRKDLTIDVNLCSITAEFDEGLRASAGSDETSLASFVSQMRWIYTQYRNIGEDVMRLEAQLHRKLEQLDKLHEKIPTILQLELNDALPELIESFSNYAKHVFDNSQFEDMYKELIHAYKKWNICRHIVSLHTMTRNVTTEPQCTICLIEPISYVSVPCGHTFCSTCSKKQVLNCYICRGHIRERVKLFMC